MKFVLFGYGDDPETLKKSWGRESKEVMSKGLAPEVGAANSQAGSRAPGPGLGVNYVIFPPAKSKGTGYRPETTEMINEASDKGTGALHVDKEDYEVQERQSNVRHYIYPEEYTEAHKDARKGSKERMKMVKKESTENVREPKNKAEITE